MRHDVLRWLMVCSLIAAAISFATAQAQVASTVVARAVDEGGGALPGACYTVSRPVGGFFNSNVSACDGDDGADDGVTTVNNVYFGTGWFLVMDIAPAGYLVGETLPYEIQAGGSADLTFTLRKGGRSGTFNVVNEAGKAVAGGCAQVYRAGALANPGQYVARGCAAEGARDKAIHITGLPPGNYVSLVNFPDGGHLLKGTVPALKGRSNRDAEVSVTAVLAGSLAVTVVNAAGEPVPNVCVEAIAVDEEEATFNPQACAYSEPGQVVFPAVATGEYELHARQLPQGVAQSKAPVTVTVKQGRQATASLALQDGGQGVIVTLVDQNGQPAVNGCLGIGRAADGSTGRFVASGCDVSPGNATADGVITLWGLDPDDYLLNEFRAPDGAAQMKPATVTVVENQAAEVTVPHVPGAVVNVSLHDEQDAPLTGGCFLGLTAITEDEPTLTSFACDTYDTTTDGRSQFVGLPAGEDVTVVPVVVPGSHGLPRAETVTATEGVEVTLTTRSGGEEVAIKRVDAAGEPASGSCYLIYAQRQGGRGQPAAYTCDGFDLEGSDGVAHISGLQPGRYLVSERYAPDGEEMATEDAPLVVKDGENAEVTIGS